MRHKRNLFFISLPVLAFFLGGMFFITPYVNAEPDPDRQKMKEITSGMVCLCGCGNLILATCTCGEAEKERDYVLSLIKMGKSRKEIVDIMVEKKGTQVLAAPEKKGLNWILWVVVPYILPVVAMIMVSYLLVYWVRKKPQVGAESTELEKDSPERDEYLKKLNEELDEFS